MIPTQEEIIQIAIECDIYEVGHRSLQEFATRMIEIGRKEQRESDAKLFDGYPNPDGLCGQVTRKSAAEAIRNNTGE